MATAPTQKLDIGRVLTLGVGVLSKNAVPFFGLALVLAGLPGAYFQYWLLSVIGTEPALEDVLSMAFWWPIIGGVLASFLSYTLLQGALIGATVQHLSGRPVDLGRNVGGALTRIIPIILVSLLTGLCVVFGFLLLIVPGIIIYLVLIVSVPAMVAEQRGVLDSMSRSSDLTRGYRPMIFLFAFVLGIFNSMISPLFEAIFTAIANALGPAAPAIYVLSAGAAVSSALTGMIGAVMIAALYLELRRLKEGTSAETLVDVFG